MMLRNACRSGVLAGAVAVQRRRVLAACLLIACLGLTLPISGVVWRAVPGNAARDGPSAAQQAGFFAVMSQEAGTTSVVDPETVASAFSGELPSFFGKEDVLLDEASLLAAYLVVGTAADAALDLARDMEACGWTCVRSGNESFETFRKDGGVHRWAFASCTEIGDQVRVTIQCA